MLTIKTIQDIRRIQNERLLPEEMFLEIEQYFKDLVESLTGEPDGWQTYNLELDGPILVLEPGADDLSKFANHGLTWESNGAPWLPIEFTSIVKLQGMELFKTLIVLDNSFCLTIYSQVGQFGQAFDDFLVEHLDSQGVE